jgi:acetylornithine deacetylase
MDPAELTKELIVRYSPTGEEGVATDFMAEILAGCGYRVLRQPVTEGRCNIYATGERPPVVVFATHLDVVPPALPLAEDSDWIYGRGACDAKGVAAAMVAAALRLRDGGEDRIGLLFTVGEEIGSDGAKAAGSLEPKGQFVINGEPTENKLSIGQKGAFGLRLTAKGRAAHSAYPEEGVSAIELLLRTLERLRGLTHPSDPLLGSTTLNIGRITGGVAANVIAGEATADLLFRTVASPSLLWAAVERSLAPGVTVTVTIDSPPVRAPALPGWETTVVRYGSDLPHLASWGTGYQLGPGTIKLAHSDEERIRKADLGRAVELYAKLSRQLIAQAESVEAVGCG